MSTRNNDSRARFSGIADFVIRKQNPSLWQILAIFLVVLLLCLIVAVLTMDKIPLIIFLFLFLASLGSYMILLLQRSRDIILTTEFQNALFASALDYNRTFCLIIKNDGNLVYMDRSFQKIFPDFIREGHLSITNFLQHGKVDDSEAKKIFDAIERSVGDKVICTMYGSDGKEYRLMISIEPIPRPAGFIMLHAREYVEQRVDVACGQVISSDNILLSKSGLTLFSSIMDKMNTGIYVVDIVGNIIYANPTLENWLAYKENEITYGNFSLKDIVKHDDGRSMAIMPDNFEGEVSLKKKAGGTIRVFINQKVIRGEDKKMLGCMATINTIAESDPTLKKKLW